MVTTIAQISINDDGALIMDSDDDAAILLEDVKGNEDFGAPDKSADDDMGEDEASLAVSLASRSRRRGSRFSTDGTPLFLKAYLEASTPELHFYFNLKARSDFQPLENEVDRRVMGTKVRYEMIDGAFQVSKAFTCPPYVVDLGDSGRKSPVQHPKLADVYHIILNQDIDCFIGVLPGWKVPIVTNKNPHKEGLIDHHRAIYLPHTEDKNVFMELPNSPGLFFTTQLISGGEVIIAYDRTLHKHWVVVINQAYTPPKHAKYNVLNYLSDEDGPWRRAVENRSYADKVIVSLLTELGSSLEKVARVTPSAPPGFHPALTNADGVKSPAQKRLDNLFRDEINDSKEDTKYYYYQHECIVYGFFEEESWKFGIKDRGRSNGFRLYTTEPEALSICLKNARYPL